MKEKFEIPEMETVAINYYDLICASCSNGDDRTPGDTGCECEDDGL